MAAMSEAGRTPEERRCGGGDSLTSLRRELSSAPMYAIAILRYRRPLDEVLPVVDAHRAYLKGLRDEGTLLASGPFEPRAGGALLLRVADDGALAALDRVRDGDPFTKLGLAQYELLPWAPTFGKEELDRAFAK